VATTTITHSGSSLNKDRQESAHVHATLLSADNKYLFVPDLGMDKVMVYRFNAQTGKLTETPNSVSLQPGSGPRHISFHPGGKWAYLTQEMAGTITAFSYSNGKLRPIQTINMLPADYKGAATVADIHVSPDGKYVYASNRDASNTIAIFRINQQTGKLSLVGHQSTLGRTPRNFNFDPSGNFLLAANQNTNDIEVFKVDHKTGKLTATDKAIAVFNPVCILFE
jgi:6-phosphogluconolactonase